MNQTELYLMMTVTGRERLPDFIRLYKDKGLETHVISLGYGTADKKLTRLLALGDTEKMVVLTVLTGRKWLEVKKAMSVRLRIEAAGVGIAYICPLSSVGGKRELMFLTDGQGFQKGEEQTLKGTDQELLIVICNQGYNETVMDAARAVGTRGGTVIHARGTGQDKAERFLGISLASEKDLVLIVTPIEKKKDMMQRIMHDAGPGTRAGAVVFSLPVTDTAGMILRPQSEELDEAETGEEAAKADTGEPETPQAQGTEPEPAKDEQTGRKEPETARNGETAAAAGEGGAGEPEQADRTRPEAPDAPAPEAPQKADAGADSEAE